MNTKRDTFLLLGATSLRSSATLVLAMVLTRLLSTTSFGQFRAAQVVATLSVAFLVVSLPQSLLYLYPTSEPEARRRLALQTFLQLFGLSLVVALGLVAFSPFIASAFGALDSRLLVYCAAGLAVGQALSTSAPTTAVARGRVLGSARYELALGIVPAGVVVLAALGGASPLRCLVALGSTHLALGALFWYRLVPSWRGWSADTALLRRQWSLAGPQTLNSMLGSVANQSDKFLVAALFRPEQFAIYACGAFEVPLVTLLPYVLTKTIAPRLALAFEARETARFLALWHQAIRLTSAVLFPCTLVLWVLAEPIIGLLFPAAYQAAVAPFRIFLLLIPLRLTGYGLVLQATGTARPILTAAASGLMTNLALAWWLIPVLGPAGAAWAAVGGQVVSVVLHLRAIRGRLAIGWLRLLPLRTLGSISGCTAIAGALAYSLGLAWTGPAGAVAGAGASAVAYLALAGLTGCLRQADVAFLRPKWIAPGAGLSRPA